MILHIYKLTHPNSFYAIDTIQVIEKVFAEKRCTFMSYMKPDGSTTFEYEMFGVKTKVEISSRDELEEKCFEVLTTLGFDKVQFVKLDRVNGVIDFVNFGEVVNL